MHEVDDSEGLINEIEKRTGVRFPRKLAEWLEKDPEERRHVESVRDLVRDVLGADPSRSVEIAGYQVKVVASNIRRPNLEWENLKLAEQRVAQEGDMALAEVVVDNGSTIRIENAASRDVRIYQGDKVVVVFGHRHTGTSEFGGIPEKGWNIDQEPIVDLLCHGGIVGRAESVPSYMGGKPTQLKVLSLLESNRGTTNVRDLFPAWDTELKPSAPIIASCGTGAEIGKTTTAGALIRTLKAKGLRVAATKLAGTGRLRDLLALKDAGADISLDFPDVGMPSTYTSPDRYTAGIRTLINRLNEGNPDVIVAEFGGDIIEANIPTFFNSEPFKRLVQAIIHSSGDVMGMKGSLDQYRAWGIGSPIHLTYPIRRNQVGTAERVREQLGLAPFDALKPEQVEAVVTSILSRVKLYKIG